MKILYHTSRTLWIKVAKGTSVSNVLSSVKRPIYFHLAPLSCISLSPSPALSEQPSVSFFLHRVPFSSYATKPLFSHSPFFNYGTTFLPSIGIFRLALTRPPSGPQGALCSVSQPRPRCGNIARAGVLPAR